MLFLHWTIFDVWLQTCIFTYRNWLIYCLLGAWRGRRCTDRWIDRWVKTTWLHGGKQEGAEWGNIGQLCRCAGKQETGEQTGLSRTRRQVWGREEGRWRAGRRAEARTDQTGAMTGGTADRDHIHMPHFPKETVNLNLSNSHMIHESAASCHLCRLLQTSFCHTSQAIQSHKDNAASGLHVHIRGSR